MTIIKAEKAVRRHLLTLSPQLPTAYEAIPFTAPTGMYQRLQFVVNPPTDPTFGNYYHRENIQVQIFVADKLDVGTTGAITRAQTNKLGIMRPTLDSIKQIYKVDLPRLFRE